MADLLPAAQHGLEHAAAFCELLLEGASVLCVLAGLAAAAWRGLRPGPERGSLRHVRLAFGAWLALALELQVGADIVATIATPTFEALGRLAATTAIRTFLNYFLARELAEAHGPASPVHAPPPTPTLPAP